MDRIEKFEELMADIEYFIKNPTDFLYENIEDPNYQEIIECTRAIAVSNAICLSNKAAVIEKLSQTINNTKAIVATPKAAIVKSESKPESKREYKDLSEIIEYITYSQLDEETEKKLSHLSAEDLLRIKLHFYKKYINIKAQIRRIILENPTANITSLQRDLGLLEITIEFIKELMQKEENEITEEQDKDYSNVILTPNGKKSSFVFEDISLYPERSKEIKLIIDKVIDGYFLKTKDTKPIEGFQEKIYEYKHPNGIRVLYIVDGNIIYICSLFFKDKQKSSKIANEYEEAVNRYYYSREYVETNFSNPDFHIEQSELKGQLYALLENDIALLKKAGE